MEMEPNQCRVGRHSQSEALNILTNAVRRPDD